MIANKLGNYGVIKVGPVHKRRRSKNISFLYSVLLFIAFIPISTSSQPALDLGSLWPQLKPGTPG